MEIWDREHECMDREVIEQLQLERLQATLHRAYKNVTCYRNKFNQHGIDPDDVQSLADLSSLPFTTKEDLRLNYPYGMFAVPLREVVRIHCSSGTTGQPRTSSSFASMAIPKSSSLMRGTAVACACRKRKTFPGFKSR